jgi:cellulose synthase/poly-beta-1,6-N-acetylglucosamine synthase-like glycosyltransferase
VLVPAHNEAEVIGATLADIIPQLSSCDRLVVVADNCTGSTAAIAREAGAEVVERTDTLRRGKGYALDFGIHYLTADPPEGIVVVDADCRMTDGSLDRIAERAIASGRPVQALYLMGAPSGGSDAKARVGEFAWVVKNRVRPLGLHRLGLPCQLMGAGMSFSWSVLRRANVAGGEIVEDMKLGLDLARQGYPPLFCPEALVTSEFPTDAAAGKTQRTRWEHGHLGMIFAELPGLLWQAARSRDVKLLAIALDLAVPPLALLAILVASVVATTGVSAAAGWASAAPLYVALAGAGGLAFAVLVAWLGWGRRILSLRDLAVIPLYALAKLPIYMLFWVRRQKAWMRTPRR